MPHLAAPLAFALGGPCLPSLYGTPQNFEPLLSVDRGTYAATLNGREVTETFFTIADEGYYELVVCLPTPVLFPFVILRPETLRVRLERPAVTADQRPAFDHLAVNLPATYAKGRDAIPWFGTADVFSDGKSVV